MALSLASLYPQRVIVGVGDLAVSDNHEAMLSTYALGSCVGLVAYEPRRRVGGIIHLMLPESAIAPAKAAQQPAMFADTGLPEFFRQLASFRVRAPLLRLFLAGGANVVLGHDPFRIGERNIGATVAYLERSGMALAESATGGSINRTVHLELATGRVTIRTPTGEERVSLGI